MTCRTILENHVALLLMLIFLSIVHIAASDAHCGNLPIIHNGQLLGDPEPPFNINDKVSYKCNEDYRSDKVSPEVTCTLKDGVANWTDIEGACKPIVISCHDPGYIENAKRIGNSFTFPNSVTYICNEGYRMTGIGTKYCSKTGRWLPPDPPYCEAILCPALAVPQNGNVLFSNRRLNSVATYNCDRNFKLFGNAKRVCQVDGTWNGSSPVCEAITCPHPGVPKNGRILGRNDGNFYAFDIVIFRCDDDSPPVTSKCRVTGDWSKNPPICPETDEPTTMHPEEENPKKDILCENPGKIEHGYQIILGYHINSTVTYNCEQGYELRGKATLLCLENGKWDLDKLPICVKPLGAPVIIGIVFGVIFICLVVAFLWYKYRVKGIRNYGKKSKALTADATDIEEITGLDKDKKKIPVTVL